MPQRSYEQKFYIDMAESADERIARSLAEDWPSDGGDWKSSAVSAKLERFFKDSGLLFEGAAFSLTLADVIAPGVTEHILMMIE